MKNYGRQILRKWNIFRVFFFLLSFCLCAGNLTLTSQAANSASASTVRLSKTEGTVEVSDSAGKAAFYRQDMRLANGDHTVTAERSYAWFSLDDTKVVKEDAVSDVEVRKRGQKLEVLVNSGSLFFNITEPLKEDESLNIRTSTMVMGVRGTCGVIKGVGEGVTCLQLLTGHLDCIVTNPETGDTKIISLEAGDEAYFYADQPGQDGVTNIVIDRLAVEDLNGFVLMELVGDQDLLNKIREESGLDFSAYTIDDARARLLQDQADTAAKNNKPLTVNNRKINNGIKDPVWEKDKDPQPDTSGDDSSSSSSDTPTKSRVVRLTMKVTATEVQNYLNDPDVDQVILMPNSDTSQNTLDVDIDLNVPEGKTLTTQRGVYVDVDSDHSVTVDGTANLSGNLTNNGEIKVNSSNTLRVDADVLNYGSFVNTESGRTIVTGKFIGYRDGALENRGQFEGMVSGEGMFFLNQGTLTGELIGDFQYLELVGGTLNGTVDASITEIFSLEGGAVNGTVSLSGDTASFKLTGGTITANSGDAALSIDAGELINVYLEGGTVTNNGDGLALKYGGTGTLSYGGGTTFQTKTNNGVVEPAIDLWEPVSNGTYYVLQEMQGNTITFNKPDALSELKILVNGTEVSGSAKAQPGDTVEVVFENAASDTAYSVYGQLLDGAGNPVADTMLEGVIEPGASMPYSFTMPDSDVTLPIEGYVLYKVTIDNTSTAFRDGREYYLGGNLGTPTGYFPVNEEVRIDMVTVAGEDAVFNMEARNADGKLFLDTDNQNSYSELSIAADSTGTFSFIMPAGNVSVTGETLGNDLAIVHLESGTSVFDDIFDALSALPSDGLMIVRAGAGTGSDSFTIPDGDEVVIGSDHTLRIDEGVTVNIPGVLQVEGSLRNNGKIVVPSYGMLMEYGNLTNNGEILIEAEGEFSSGTDTVAENAADGTFTNNGAMDVWGTFRNNGTFANAAGATILVNPDSTLTTSGTMTNDGTITIAAPDGTTPGGTLEVDDVPATLTNNGTITNNGTFNNQGTVNNTASGIIDGTGTFSNISGHTLNNYGTFIIGDGGVYENGDGAGRNGVTNNFADGVFLNSGTIVNNDGSTFRNYGTIIEETPDAVSPDLAPGSKPIVHYGEDPETVLSGIPEGAVGGQCGDTLFWYLEELEEEEAEKLRHFTEGHTASASDAERAEDDASVSYILHITGSGAMDNFDLDGGKSTAPWFEELDGAVRAVKIDEGVTQIGKNAFYGIRTLAYVSFAGTDTEWKSVKVQSGNEALDKTILLFSGDDDLVLGDPLVAEDEEVSWTEPEAKPIAAAAGKATASDAEKEEPEEGKKEQGDTEQKPETPETPWTAEPENRKPEETESGKSGNGKQDSEA